MEKLIFKKIAVLNQISTSVLRDENNASIITKFAERSVEILNANFGFAFGKSGDNNKFELLYSSPDIFFNPSIPKKIGGYHTLDKKNDIFFDQNVKSENYETNIADYLKSYIIIPVRYGEHTFGSIVLCYKNKRNFTEEELVLAEIIKNMASRAVNINWLIEREQKSLALAEKQKTTEMLLSQERLKTEFMSNSAHELRTPLAIMKGNVDLALMDKGNLKSAEEALKKVNTEINALSDILNDLSLLTTFGENLKEIKKTAAVDIRALLRKLAERMKTVASGKNIQIKIKERKKENSFVLGNEGYLEKLFLNLIKNAITYGRNNGNIVIDIFREKKLVKIKMTDDGIGISAEDLPKIFDRFYRVDKAHTHESNENHSGLGLAIAKWSAEIHGGKIEVESALKVGSIFTITLPRLIRS